MRMVCPRCLSYGSLVERMRGNRRYYEVQHSSRGRKSYCHLGPDIYIHGSKTNPISLRGMLDPQRILEYLIQIRDCLPSHLPKLDLDRFEQVLREMMEIAESYRSKQPRPTPSKMLEQMGIKSTENLPERSSDC